MMRGLLGNKRGFLLFCAAHMLLAVGEMRVFSFFLSFRHMREKEGGIKFSALPGFALAEEEEGRGKGKLSSEYNIGRV